MQLPRGSFRDLKRDSGLQSLISQMRDNSFSGYSFITLGETSILLVFSKGIIILAEYGETKGPAAMEQISHLGDRPIEVILHSLTDTQLQLALEFNPDCMLAGEHMEGAGRGPPLSKRVIISPSTGERKEDGIKLPEEKILSDTDLSGRPGSGRPKSVQPVLPKGAEDESSILIQQLDALDVLEIKSMTEKFRGSCRRILEKLELEGLLEQELDKENNDHH